MRVARVAWIAGWLLLKLVQGGEGIAQSQVAYPNQNGQRFVWNGVTLMPLYSNGAFPCDRWQVWYFKQGDAHTPGSQWGSEDGKSADEVLKRQQKAVAFDHQYAKFFRVQYPTDPFVHDNFVGPICISEATLAGRPQALKLLEEIGDRADKLQGLIENSRTAMNLVEQEKPGEGNAYLLKDKTPLEEFLTQVHDIPEKLNKTHQLVMSNISVPLIQLEANLSDIDKKLEEAEQLVSKLPKPTPSLRSRSDDRCLLVATSSSKVNCDSAGQCDVRTFKSSCDSAGVYTESDCTWDHRTGQTHCQ
ncbi:MAG TPA: hypothetical protein VIJ79_07680 [Acidobacteriaceae bacterium]